VRFGKFGASSGNGSGSLSAAQDRLGAGGKCTKTSTPVEDGFRFAKINLFWLPDRPSMTYVVTETCIRCKYTDCVDVCPVDCFREGPNFLVIDPDECIDCTLCVAECPVEAIFAEDDVPPDQAEFTALNAELSKIWKPIIERKPAPPDADEWKEVKVKRQHLER